MKKTVRTYSKAWSFDNRVYSIQGIPLSKPLEGWDIVSVIIFLALAWKIEMIIPLIAKLHPIIRYIAMPIGMTVLIHRIPMDGKSPPKYIFGMVKYLLVSRWTYTEHFKRYFGGQKKRIRASWYCSRGTEIHEEREEDENERMPCCLLSRQFAIWLRR